MDGESRRRGSVLLKGVREFFLEIFEKSIDKHKIDAILNAPSFSSGLLRGCLTVGEASWRIPRKNPAFTIPIQRAVKIAGSFYVFKAWKGTVQGFCALCLWGCSLKSVE